MKYATFLCTSFTFILDLSTLWFREMEMTRNYMPPACTPSRHDVTTARNSGIHIGIRRQGIHREASLKCEGFRISAYPKAKKVVILSEKKSGGIMTCTRVYPKVSGLSRNEIYTYNNKHSLRTNTKCYSGKTR
jgi:hypothetical protein